MAQNAKPINSIMEKALKSKVTQQVKDDIAAVMDVNTDRMNARQAMVYAQLAKAIKGDKTAFEAINAMCGEKAAADKTYCVEVKVVE